MNLKNYWNKYKIEIIIFGFAAVLFFYMHRKRSYQVGSLFNPDPNAGAFPSAQPTIGGPSENIDPFDPRSRRNTGLGGRPCNPLIDPGCDQRRR